MGSIPMVVRGWTGGFAEFDNHGLGCAAGPPGDLALMEQAQDPGRLRSIVERVILADRAAKEQAPA
jgi:hypothetical protein